MRVIKNESNHTEPVRRVPRRKSSEIDNLLGRRLKLRRTLLGYTQAELADLCFLSPQQIHKYENGSSKMSAGRLDQMSKALDVPVGWFFEDVRFKTRMPNDLLELLSDPQLLRILTIFRNIRNDETKSLIISLAENVASHLEPDEMPATAGDDAADQPRLAAADRGN